LSGGAEIEAIRGGFEAKRNGNTEVTEARTQSSQRRAERWRGLRGEEAAEFVVEEGAVAGVHGDDLKGHAGVCMDAADDGAAANLSCGGIQQELNGTAKRHGPLGAYEEAPESEAVHEGDVAGHAGLPGDDEGLRRTDTRVFALVRRGH